MYLEEHSVVNWKIRLHYLKLKVQDLKINWHIMKQNSVVSFIGDYDDGADDNDDNYY